MSGAAARDVSVHATVVAIGEAGVLLRGPSGIGKSRQAQALIAEGLAQGAFARLVADDRARLTVVAGRLIARAPASIAGVIEERGTGLLPAAHEPAVVVRCLVDFDDAARMERLPAEADAWDAVGGVSIARIRLDRGLSSLEGARRILGRLGRD